jgi:Arc/MetJ-type ribon-helix-helix transcriptional regulator
MDVAGRSGSMNVSLSPELEKRMAQKVERGDVDSADALVEHPLTFYLEYGDMDAEERPAEEVFSDLRAKYGISR